MAHEVLHIALRHPQRYLELQQLLGDVDLQLFNICADAIVNSALGHLGWLQLPPRAVLLESCWPARCAWARRVDSALLQWDVERLYRAIDDRRPHAVAKRQWQERGRARRRQAGAGTAGSGGTAQAARDGARRIDGRAARAQLGARQPARPGARRRRTAAAPEDEAEATREWCERLLRAHAGDGEHSLLRTLLADLPRSRTPWEQVLRTQLARALSPQRSRVVVAAIALVPGQPGRARAAHRRMPFEPGFSPCRRCRGWSWWSMCRARSTTR